VHPAKRNDGSLRAAPEGSNDWCSGDFVIAERLESARGARMILTREDQPSIVLDLSAYPDHKSGYFQGFLMARGGLEPPTPRFSVECSTGLSYLAATVDPTG
jgi:hypothetical protein